MNQRLRYNQSRKSQSSASRTWNYQNLENGQIYLKIPMPYLDNPSEEAISEHILIKEQHETPKLLNEEIRMLQ